MLTIDQIHTYYGDSHILQGVSMEIKAGEVVCLLGRNGAGKTTTLTSIIGFTPPRSGKITFEEIELTQLPPQQISRLGISWVPENRRIFPELTVVENLKIAESYGQTPENPWTVKKIYELFPGLDERRIHRGVELSGGEQQMLAIARGLMANPRLLLLDEPTEGLAPLLIKVVEKVMGKINETGTTVLLVEQHNLDTAMNLGDRYYLISKGQIVYQGDRADFIDNSDIRHKYLGV